MSLVTERLYEYYANDLAKLIAYHKWCKIKPHLQSDIKEVLNYLEDNTNVMLDIPLYEYQPKLVIADLSKTNSSSTAMKMTFELAQDINLNLAFDGQLEMNGRGFIYGVHRSYATITKADKIIISNLDFYSDLKTASFMDTIREALPSIANTSYSDSPSYFSKLRKSLNTSPIYYSASKDVNTVLNIVAHGLPTDLGDDEYQEFIKGIKENPAIADGELDYDRLHNALLISKDSPINDLTASTVANVYLNDLLGTIDGVVVDGIQAHEVMTKLITSVANKREIQPFIESIPNYIADEMDWGNVQSDANHAIVIALASAQRLKEKAHVALGQPSVTLPCSSM